MKYAKETTVSIAKSRAEIEETVMRYGADQFGSAIDQEHRRAVIQFRIRRAESGLLVRFALPMPDPKEDAFTKDRRYSWRTVTDAESTRRYDQTCRQRWRALLLCIKAKLEAVECGITTFEEEFLAHIVLPNGQTMGEHTMPQLARIMEGEMPTLLEDLRL